MRGGKILLTVWRKNMLNEQKKVLKCVCGHNGDGFAEIVFILNDSVVKIGTTDEDNIKIKNTLKMYACPKCKTLQIV
jgi:acetone carboxylase gamma subunit